MLNPNPQNLQPLLKLKILSLVTLLVFFQIISALATPRFDAFRGVITGKVINDRGEPLSGVTVHLGGTNTTVISGADGSFSIRIPGNSGKLTFSYVGMQTQEVSVSDNGNNVEVRLIAIESSLDDVVVVGYGTQKKVNLTGSVGSVSGKELVKRPTPNVQNLLQGRVAGLDVVQSTGQPGRDNASILVRGQGSFGASSAPLILVDGVIGTINNLSAEDIADVSVLKDAASAAIYGARAANGVILITTKKGKKGQNTVEYSTNVASSQATILPELIYNSVQYMELRNKAAIRFGQPAFYTDEQINWYRNPTNKEQYPNFNWMDYSFRKAPSVNHHLGFSGGSDKTSFNVSLNYFQQDGILQKNDYKRYNGLIDFSSQVHERVNIGVNVNFSYQNIIQPWLTNDDLVLIVYHSAPTYGPYLPDGSGRVTSAAFPGESAGQRSLSAVIENGAQTTRAYNVNTQAYANVDLMRGLQLQVKGAFTFYTEDYRNHQFGVPSYYFIPNTNGQYIQYDNGAPGFLGVNQTMSQSITKTFYSTLNYTTKIARNHNIKGLLGYEQQDNRSPFLSGSRRNFPNNTLVELNAAAAAGQTTGGNTTEWALQSFFGRVNYDFKGKYLLEANSRYDGSSRVHQDNRWGLFSAVSAGWRLSEEEFMKATLPAITNLKLRASLGTLGNQEIGNYPYQDILDITAYPFGGNLNSGAGISRLRDRNLRWETTKVTDFGMDIDIKNGLIGATVDWYNKQTSGILTQRQDVPASVGLSAPITNAGSMENKGWELELRHQKSIGSFNYSVYGIYSAFRNKVTKVLAPNKGIFEVGLPYNSIYTYEWIGIFQSQDEINKSPKQPSSGNLKPGDLKIADRDGNGIVGPEDRISISPFPSYTYSFGLNANWKGFTFSTFFQGIEGRKLLVNGWGIDPYFQGAPPPAKFLNAWTETNPSTTVPAVYLNGYPGVSGYQSTYYLMDASYLRLKNVYLSYRLPKNLIGKIRSKEMTVYVSGDNLLTFTNYEGADPERAGGGRYAQFPQLKVFTAGLNIKF
ncbi:MAG: TonB-dependent receptor plug [Segetibacter sp.]|nr:TonB-dependent receptor plug [Segetibacter sp.]